MSATSVAHAQTETPSLVVTTLADVVDNTDNQTSLREAILFAENNDGADTITFAVAGTIVLEGSFPNPNPLPILNGTLTISNTQSEAVTIDGNFGRIFEVASGANVTLENLILSGTESQQSGGPLINIGTLTIRRSIIENNTTVFNGGAVLNAPGATLTIERSTLRNNRATLSGSTGGAIENRNGTVTIVESTISGNSASGAGGGIRNTGTLTLLRSTISANSGGGLRNEAGATASIDNSTLAFNNAFSFGGLFNAGTLVVRNSTIAGNSAGATSGIFNDSNGTVSLDNTIVAGNKERDSPQVNVTPQGSFNIIGGTAQEAGLENDGNGADALPLLKDNGGPTQTIALLASSPAVNAGAPSFSGNFDQRGTGFNRIKDGRVDIGAFESDFVTNSAPTLQSSVISATQNAAFSRQLLGSDPDGDTLSYLLSDGSLPSGVTLSNNGLLSGTPTQPGKTRFNITVSDGRGGQATAQYLFIVGTPERDSSGPTVEVISPAQGTSLSYSELLEAGVIGNVQDTAPNGIAPSGVRLLVGRLYRANGDFWNGSTWVTPASSNLWKSGLLGAGSATDERSWSLLNPGGIGPGNARIVPGEMLMPPNNYTFVVAAQDNADNWTVVYSPFALTATPSPSSSSAASASATRSANSS